MATGSEDWVFRAAAFRHLRQQMAVKPVVNHVDVAAGFMVDGERIAFVNSRRGIFKPKRMEALLSIKTVFPKRGGPVWYEDQREVHKQIVSGAESVDYAFMGDDPDAAENRWLRDAQLREVPIVYFLGVAPGQYLPIFPCFVADWDAKQLKARIVFNEPLSSPLAKPPVNAAERRYALRLVKQRLHQASFREAVVEAYEGRCALSGLPEAALIDAAHIVADADTDFGQPVVPNGIPLSKIHHAAFDAHLIGIDADFGIQVSDRILKQTSSPILNALKSTHGLKMTLPARKADWPDRERLDVRFKQFLASN